MSGTGDFHKDQESKFSDEEIRALIKSAASVLQQQWYEDPHIATNPAANTALAMIAYNEMIDHRWMRYYGQEWHKRSHVLIEPEEE